MMLFILLGFLSSPVRAEQSTDPEILLKKSIQLVRERLRNTPDTSQDELLERRHAALGYKLVSMPGSMVEEADKIQNEMIEIMGKLGQPRRLVDLYYYLKKKDQTIAAFKKHNSADRVPEMIQAFRDWSDRPEYNDYGVAHSDWVRLARDRIRSPELHETIQEMLPHNATVKIDFNWIQCELLRENNCKVTLKLQLNGKTYSRSW